MAVASNLFTMFQERSSPGKLSGSYKQATPLLFEQTNRTYALKLFSLTISSIIPNVYVDAESGTDTTHFDVTADGGVTWTTINLIPGYYSVRTLREAIIVAFIDLGVQDPTTVDDPCVYLGLTTVNQMSYITLNTAKCIPATATQVGIRFTGQTGALPGFTTTTTFLVDGTFTGDTAPLYDYQGSEISVVTSLTAAQWISTNDGASTSTGEIVRIPIPFVMGGLITFPSYRTLLDSPVLHAQIPRYWTGYTMRFVNPRTGRDIIFGYGHVSACLQIL